MPDRDLLSSINLAGPMTRKLCAALRATWTSSRAASFSMPRAFWPPQRLFGLHKSCEPLSPPALRGFVPTWLVIRSRIPFALPRSVSIHTAAWRFLFWAGFYLDRRCAGRATSQLDHFLSYNPRASPGRRSAGAAVVTVRSLGQMQFNVARFAP